jgi:hypothetical protein
MTTHHIKSLCDNAFVPKFGAWDLSADQTYKEKLVKYFGGSDEVALTECKKIMGYVGSSAQNIMAAAKEKAEPLTLPGLVEKFWNDVMSSDIALTFIVIMGAYFFWSMLRGTSHWSSRNAVIILPTMGILGTFVGVYYSLQNFNLAQLDTSLDEIVMGLKIAFTTSIVGMLGGIIVRMANSKRESHQLTHDEMGIDDIYMALQQIRGGSDEGDPRADLADLHKALAGEGDVSISTQIMKMRTDLNDFAKTVAEANTSALIEALKDVIGDFNEKMSEQFGENFKQLNVAVGRLLEWQENYKDDLDYLRGAMKDAVEAIEACRSSIEKIAEASGSIPDHMGALKKILDNTDEQLSELEERLKAFAEMRDKAQDAFPRIEELLRSYTDKFEEAITGAMDSLKIGLKAQNDSMEDIRRGYSQLGEDIGEIGTKLGEDVKKVLEVSLNTINESIESAQDAQNEHLEAVYNKQMEAISGLEEGYDKLRADARESSQVIVNAVKNSAEEHGRFVKEVHDTQIEAVKELEGAYGELKDNAEASAQVVVEAIETNRENLESAAEVMEKSVAEIGPSIKGALTNSMEGLTASLDDFMRKQEEQSQARLRNLGEKLDSSHRQAAQNMEALMTEQLKTTRDALEEVIGDAVRLFDQYMGSVAKHMSDDYRPLMAAMRKVIEMADTLERERDQ